MMQSMTRINTASPLLAFVLSAVSILASLYLTGCSQAQDPAEYDSGPDRVRIHLISGDLQTGTAGQELADPLVFQITDLDSTPVAGVRLLSTIMEGGGQIMFPDSTDSTGCCEAFWTIGEDYNAARIQIQGPRYTGTEIYVYASMIDAQGLALIRTLNTLKLEQDLLYSMTVYGEYKDILYAKNVQLGGSNPPELASSPRFCSLFATLADPSDYLMGRSFDNPTDWPTCLSIVLRTHPPGGCEALTLTRLQEVGYDEGTNLLSLDLYHLAPILNALFWTPDGINEYGVTVGLANVRPEQTFSIDYSKPSIYITYLVRKILDQARNLDEAVAIALENNVFCPHNGSLNVHTMVADASGRSAVLEMSGGQMRIIYNSQNFQVMTNEIVYGRPLEEQRLWCNRFRLIYDDLLSRDGLCDEAHAWNLLSRVDFPSATEWSAVYHITHRTMNVVIYSDFGNVTTFGF